MRLKSSSSSSQQGQLGRIIFHVPLRLRMFQRLSHDRQYDLHFNNIIITRHLLLLRIIQDMRPCSLVISNNNKIGLRSHSKTWSHCKSFSSTLLHSPNSDIQNLLLPLKPTWPLSCLHSRMVDHRRFQPKAIGITRLVVHSSSLSFTVRCGCWKMPPLQLLQMNSMLHQTRAPRLHLSIHPNWKAEITSHRPWPV